MTTYIHAHTITDNEADAIRWTRELHDAGHAASIVVVGDLYVSLDLDADAAEVTDVLIRAGMDPDAAAERAIIDIRRGY